MEKTLSEAMVAALEAAPTTEEAALLAVSATVAAADDAVSVAFVVADVYNLLSVIVMRGR